MGPVPWVLVGEVFPARARGAGAAIISMWAWGQAFLVTLIFPPLLGIIGLSGAVWLFTAGSIAGGLFSFALCPETKGKSLDQILKELEGVKNDKFIKP
jgi:SP family facilitated glucose transporter-like MFS transporter 8